MIDEKKMTVIRNCVIVHDCAICGMSFDEVSETLESLWKENVQLQKDFDAIAANAVALEVRCAELQTKIDKYEHL